MEERQRFYKMLLFVLLITLASILMAMLIYHSYKAVPDTFVWAVLLCVFSTFLGFILGYGDGL